MAASEAAAATQASLGFINEVGRGVATCPGTDEQCLVVKNAKGDNVWARSGSSGFREDIPYLLLMHNRKPHRPLSRGCNHLFMTVAELIT